MTTCHHNGKTKTLPVKVLLAVFGLGVYFPGSVSLLLLQSITCLFPCGEKLIDVHEGGHMDRFSNSESGLKEAIRPSIHLSIVHPLLQLVYGF